MPNVEWVNIESFYDQTEFSERLYNDNKAHLQPKVKMKILYRCELLLHKPLTTTEMALVIEAYLSGGI